MSDKIKNEKDPSKPDAPDLKMLIIALRAMDEDPRMAAYTTTVRYTLMLAEAAAKAVETLEMRITLLEKQIEAQAFMRP